METNIIQHQPERLFRDDKDVTGWNGTNDFDHNYADQDQETLEEEMEEEYEAESLGTRGTFQASSRQIEEIKHPGIMIKPSFREGLSQQIISKISEEDEDLEQSFYSNKKGKSQMKVDIPVQEYIAQQRNQESQSQMKKAFDNLNQTMEFKMSTEKQRKLSESKHPRISEPLTSSNTSVKEEKPFRVVVNAVEEVSTQNYLLKKQSSITYKVPVSNRSKTTVRDEAKGFTSDKIIIPLNLQTSQMMIESQNDIAFTPQSLLPIIKSPVNMYDQNLMTGSIAESAYQKSNKSHIIQKRFGVYHVTNDLPVIEKRQRLIERLAIKQDVENSNKSQHHKRIASDTGRQIMQSNNTIAVSQHLPKKLPNLEQLQSNLISQSQVLPQVSYTKEEFKGVLWNYLSCADSTNLLKLLKTKNQDQRDFNNLLFSKPLPFHQAKVTRVLSPLYVGVAIGSIDCLNVLSEHLININIEEGIAIRKKKMDENSDDNGFQQGIVKKRTPLQLACAMGLYKIVEWLLSKGAKADGITKEELVSNIEFSYPPILLCLNKKYRKTLIEELQGIQWWQIFDKDKDIDHGKCLKALLELFPIDTCKAYSSLPRNEQLGQCGPIDIRVTALCTAISKTSKIEQFSEATSEAEDQEEVLISIAGSLIGSEKLKLNYCCSKNPVLAALTTHRYKLARFLIDKGVNCNWRQPHETQAVHIAVQQNNYSLLQEIIGWNRIDGIDFGLQDQDGRNIFHQIALLSNVDLFLAIRDSRYFNDFLVQQSLNQPMRHQGFETLPLLLCSSNLQLASLYLQHGASIDLLSFHGCYSLFSNSNLKFLEFLIREAGLPVDELNSSNQTCLVITSNNNELNKMKFLLANGADPDVRIYQDDQRFGITLLHDACLVGSIEKVKLLLQYGANFNLKCVRGRTTLDFLKATFEGKSERKKDAIKALLYKYTVKNSILHRPM